MTTTLCAYGCGQPAPHAFGKGGTRFRCDPDSRNCPVEGARLKEVAAASRARFHTKAANNKGEPQPCTGCGAPGRFYSTHYKTWRCEKVAAACPGNRDKWEQSMLEQYGTTKAAHIAGVQEKRSKTLIESHAARGREGRLEIDRKRQATMQQRHGVQNAGQRPEHWEGIKERFLAEHGVEHWLQTEEGMAKQKATVTERYGADHVQRVPEFRAKTETTNLERYGGIAPLQSPEVRERWRATLMERYGAECMMHSPTLFKKQQASLYRSKNHTLPSGKIVRVHGYEGHGLNHLFSLGYGENDVQVATESGISIPYSDPITGKGRKYYPDILIRSRRHLVEVKSPFTLYNDRTYPVNVAKRDACVAQGWPYTILVFEYDGSLVELLGDALN